MLRDAKRQGVLADAISGVAAEAESVQMSNAPRLHGIAAAAMQTLLMAVLGTHVWYLVRNRDIVDTGMRRGQRRLYV